MTWQPARIMAQSLLDEPPLAPTLHNGKTLVTKNISSSSVPHDGLSLIWSLFHCEVIQNHQQESHWLLIAALTFHPMLGLSYNSWICGERIVLFLQTLNIDLARVTHICIVHLSSLKLKSLQAWTTVLSCFCHGYCSSQTNVPNSLSLIFDQYRSEHKFVRTRWEVRLSKGISSLSSNPAVTHQICCNCTFTLYLALAQFKLQSLWGRSHMAPSGKDFNPSACRY